MLLDFGSYSEIAIVSLLLIYHVPPPIRSATTWTGFAGVGYNREVLRCSLFLPVHRIFFGLAFSVGEWLSLVEHLVRDQGVGGSNPLSPTNLFNHLQAN